MGEIIANPGLANKLSALGTYIVGTNNTSAFTIPTATWTTVSSLTIPCNGIWLVMGSHLWESGSGVGTSTCYMTITYGSSTESTSNVTGTLIATSIGNNVSGGANTMAFANFTSAPCYLNLRIYQQTGSDKTVRSVHLRAIRIA